MHRRKGRDGGYTLIEVLIVTAILALVAAFLTMRPPTSGTAGYRVQARHLSRTLATAHQTAILARRDHEVVFEFDSERYRLETRVPDPEDPYEEIVRESFGTELRSPLRLVTVWIGEDSISHGEARIPFPATGLPPTHVIHLQAGEGSDAVKLSVALHPLLGDPIVVDGHREVEDLFEAFEDAEE